MGNRRRRGPFMAYTISRQRGDFLIGVLEDIVHEDPKDMPVQQLLSDLKTQRSEHDKDYFGIDPDAPLPFPIKEMPFIKKADFDCACGSEVDLVQTPDGPKYTCRDFQCNFEPERPTKE